MLINSNSTLNCPTCDPHNPDSNSALRLTAAVVEGHREDADPTYTEVTTEGDVLTGEGVQIRPFSSGSGGAISILAWCENCTSQFAIEFRQHNGHTRVRYHSVRG